MVEVAKEVTKPDYLSLVNQSGSGFNVSELVNAIVGSELNPKEFYKLQSNRKQKMLSLALGFLHLRRAPRKTILTL